MAQDQSAEFKSSEPRSRRRERVKRKQQRAPPSTTVCGGEEFNPQQDFRDSMVEMIEEGIRCSEELEEDLAC